MESWQVILIGAGIIVFGLILIALVFRKPISKAIESGAPFGIHLGLRESKLLVGGFDKNKNRKETPDEIHVDEDKLLDIHEVDPNLIQFTPPLEPSRFHIVSLSKQKPNEYLNWPFAPTGLTIIYDIPFLLLPVVDINGNLLGHSVLIVQPSQYNRPVRKIIPVNINQVVCVHLLISAGNGWRTHKGLTFLYKRIGYIDVEFSIGEPQRIPLILGKNIREWSFGNNTNLVTEIDLTQAKPAWLSHDNTKRFDLFSVSIDFGPKTIDSLHIVGHFEDDHPDKVVSTPSVIVSAVTCERIIQNQ